jgi:hypothetical protein
LVRHLSDQTGVWFSAAQAAMQALQPVQVLRSMTMA